MTNKKRLTYADSSKKLVYIKPGEIDVDTGANPRKREDKKAFQELKASINDKGILVPVLVHPNGSRQRKYYLICGFRRVRAATELGFPEVPALLSTKLDEENVAEIRLIDHLHRKDLEMSEEAQAFRKLVRKFKWRAEDIAEKVDKSVDYVRKRLAIADVPKFISQALDDKSIALGHALVLRGIQDAKEQKEGLANVVRHGWSVREFHHMVSERRVINKQTAFNTSDCRTCRWYGGNQRELLLGEVGGQPAVAACHNKSCFEKKLADRIAELVEKFKKQGFKVQVVHAGDRNYYDHPGTELLSKPSKWDPSRKDPERCKSCKSHVVRIFVEYDRRVGATHYCVNRKCSNWKVKSSEAATRKQDRARARKQQEHLNLLVDRARERVDEVDIHRLVIHSYVSRWQKNDGPLKRFLELHRIDVSPLAKERGWNWRQKFEPIVRELDPADYPKMIRSLALLALQYNDPDRLRKIAGPAEKNSPGRRRVKRKSSASG